MDAETPKRTSKADSSTKSKGTGLASSAPEDGSMPREKADNGEGEGHSKRTGHITPVGQPARGPAKCRTKWPSLECEPVPSGAIRRFRNSKVGRIPSVARPASSPAQRLEPEPIIGPTADARQNRDSEIEHITPVPQPASPTELVPIRASTACGKEIRDFCDPSEVGSLGSRGEKEGEKFEVAEDIEDRSQLVEVMDGLEDIIMAKVENLQISGSPEDVKMEVVDELEEIVARFENLGISGPLEDVEMGIYVEEGSYTPNITHDIARSDIMVLERKKLPPSCWEDIEMADAEVDMMEVDL